MWEYNLVYFTIIRIWIMVTMAGETCFHVFVRFLVRILNNPVYKYPHRHPLSNDTINWQAFAKSIRFVIRHFLLISLPHTRKRRKKIKFPSDFFCESQQIIFPIAEAIKKINTFQHAISLKMTLYRFKTLQWCRYCCISYLFLKLFFFHIFT